MSSNSEHNQMRKLSFLGFGTENNADPDAIKLDDEMAKVFGSIDDNRPSAAAQQRKDKFDLSHLTDRSAPTTTLKANRSDSDFGRTNPTTQQLPSAMRRRDSEQQQLPVAAHDREDDDEPLVSERARGDKHYDSDSQDDLRRVKFSAGSPVRQQQQSAEGHDENDSYDEERVHEDHRKRKARHQHYKHRKSSLQDSGAGGSGSRRSSRDTDTAGTGNGVRRVSMQPEDSTLEEADIEELTAHRSDDPRGLRRHKVAASTAGGGRKDVGQLPVVDGAAVPKKHFDHSPHEVFVQLDELTGTGEEREWKETARWIKYEEDLEEGSDRWGRPHVASLSFHSLLNLRRCLETGVVLMDLEERDLPGVAYRVVEQMVVEELIQESEKPTVMRALLLRHRHVNEHSHGGFYFGSRRKFSSYTSLQNLTPHDGTKMPRIVTSSEINGKSGTNGTKNGSDSHTAIDMKEEQTYSSQTDLKAQLNDSILRRIPVGAEATTVLVGAVDFLRQPTIAFVRLAEGIPIPGITEVPIPVRFIFILLGPKDVELDYHEVGRSIATLMSNEHFHKIAYAAEGRHKLLSAINDFLDESIVLPPGNWQRDDLLPFDELKAKSEWIRDRKQRALQQRNRDKQAIADEEHRTLLGGVAGGDGGGGGGGGGGGDENGHGAGGAGKNGKDLHLESGGEKRRSNVGPLEKTHRLWGGLINDIRRRYPMYKSDIMDGLNTETLAATVFMYFAALSTAITFGGLASDKTHNLIGISETLLSASVVGMIFHALSGQPLVIIGTTGPLLLFDEALYRFCEQNAFDFLSVRVYVGCWIAIIALVVSAFEGSVYVRLFSRFTQEIFSALITLIYIVETVMKLIKVYQRHPLLPAYLYAERPEVAAPISAALLGNETVLTEEALNVTSTEASILETPLLFAYDAVGRINQPNTALFCTMLTLGTFAFAYYLRLFRNWHFLGRTARRALGDFGVPLSICLFVTVDFLIPAVFTEKLSVPEGLSPSDPESRGWLIPLGSMPVWVPFAAIVPAMLVYILIFMESHISELIVDKPERGLKKGSGLHMDIVLLSFLNVGCGLFGMPWHCAATVRSVTHVSAVTIMSRTHAPGDKPYIADVKEQRVSGFCVALMVGLSVMASPILRLIPMSVLFGVFLYMGVASMSGVQLFDRLRLFFMPVKYHPAELYVKRVPTWKMHVFTAVQLCSLGVLWTVASSRFSLAFPFVLVLMVPLRQRLEQMFTVQELIALDGNAAKVDPNNEPDFYEQASIPA